jgi:ubiquinone/menaquinone biosynthesis C-methylase UbiE
MRKGRQVPVMTEYGADSQTVSSQNEDVRQYWDQEACGTYKSVVGALPELSREWFASVEQHRYAMEPFIHTIAEFPTHRGKTVLEVGVGAGTDHLQWARAGAVCFGVDLTQRAIDTTRAHLTLHGFSSTLQRIDAETLPFPDASFDVVYSWGVIHHSARPEQIVREIRRVLKPEGMFIGMLYARHSPRSIQTVGEACLTQGTALAILGRSGRASHGKPGNQGLYRSGTERIVVRVFVLRDHPDSDSLRLQLVSGLDATMVQGSMGFLYCRSCSEIEWRE